MRRHLPVVGLLAVIPLDASSGSARRHRQADHYGQRHPPCARAARNRLVRTRLLGGVGGGGSNPPADPIKPGSVHGSPIPEPVATGRNGHIAGKSLGPGHSHASSPPGPWVQRRNREGNADSRKKCACSA